LNPSGEDYALKNFDADCAMPIITDENQRSRTARRNCRVLGFVGFLST